MESRGRLLLPLLLLLPMVWGLDNIRTARLTTFGTQNKPTVKPSHTQPARGRECHKDTDCEGIRETKCRSDPHDSKMRCLCSDKSPPNNGICKTVALHGICTKDNACPPGAECTVPMANSTTINSTSVPSHPNSPKRCLCKEGYIEELDECSSGYRAAIPTLSVMLILTIGSILLAAH